MVDEGKRQSKRRGIEQPLDRSRGPRLRIDHELFGRISEKIARYLGSWNFIAWMSGAIAAWLLWNTLAPLSARPDPFPFIFLTLLLSLQASYAAPLILLAQNRQDDRDRVQYQEDRARTDRLIADTEYLAREIAGLRAALGEVATRDYVRGEIRDLTELVADLGPAAQQLQASLDVLVPRPEAAAASTEAKKQRKRKKANAKTDKSTRSADPQPRVSDRDPRAGSGDGPPTDPTGKRGVDPTADDEPGTRSDQQNPERGES